VTAIIFDMDGLMLDTERVARIVWQRASVELGFPMSDALYGQTLGRDERDSQTILIEAFGKDFSYPNLRQLYLTRFNEHVAQYGIDTKPGLIPLLDHLERCGVSVAVATSTGRERALLKLKGARVLERFRHIVAGDDVKRGKPAPDIFLRAAEKMTAAPSTCIVLEDSEAGIQAAHAAGMKSICIPDLKPPSPEIAKLASRVFSSLNEAREYLDACLSSETR